MVPCLGPVTPRYEQGVPMTEGSAEMYTGNKQLIALGSIILHTLFTKLCFSLSGD